MSRLVNLVKYFQTKEILPGLLTLTVLNPFGKEPLDGYRHTLMERFMQLSVAVKAFKCFDLPVKHMKHRV